MLNDSASWPERVFRSIRALANPVKQGKRILLSGVAVLWVFLPRTDMPSSRLHQTFHRQLWRDASPAARVGFLVRFVFWVPVTLGLSVYCTSCFGVRARKKTGKSLFRQWIEQVALAGRYAIPPFSYYEFGLYRDQKRGEALSYLYRFELKKPGIYEMLRSKISSSESIRALSDKAAFSLYCEARGVSAVPTIAAAEGGNLQFLQSEDSQFPTADLFFKPRSGAGGRGAAVWKYGEAGVWRNNAGSALDATGLAAHLVNLSRKRAMIVRPLVVNNRHIANLSAGALLTVRVMTCLDESGSPEVTHAHLKIAVRREALVDNYHAGGIVARVNLSTGRLDKAVLQGGQWSVHPTTGAIIEGRQLPYWAEVLDLALRAHAAFSDHVAVGWDIAILDNGPVLVEGNKSPGLDAVQVVIDGPLGSERLGKLLALHVERALAGSVVPLEKAALELADGTKSPSN